MKITIGGIVVALAAQGASAQGWWNRENPCPVVEPVRNFDVDRFISESWFVQKQQENPYQKENQLNCVTATYEVDGDSGFLNVNNYANNDIVNGENQVTGGTLFSTLCAKSQEAGVGKLEVAPCFFRNIGLFDFVGGPYWVIALGDDYEWAIISGGQPREQKTEDPVTCTTKVGEGFQDINGSGLWLFSKASAGPEAERVTAIMMEKLAELGVSPVDLKDVKQEGCRYEGAGLKGVNAAEEAQRATSLAVEEVQSNQLNIPLIAGAGAGGLVAVGAVAAFVAKRRSSAAPESAIRADNPHLDI